MPKASRLKNQKQKEASKNIVKKLNTTVSVNWQEIPVRDKDGCLIFPDHLNFRPNLTPKEVLHMGSFGGT